MHASFAYLYYAIYWQPYPGFVWEESGRYVLVPGLEYWDLSGSRICAVTDSPLRLSKCLPTLALTRADSTGLTGTYCAN